MRKPDTKHVPSKGIGILLFIVVAKLPAIRPISNFPIAELINRGVNIYPKDHYKRHVPLEDFAGPAI